MGNGGVEIKPPTGLSGGILDSEDKDCVLVLPAHLRSRAVPST